MFITVINDCRSPNEKGRQETRLISLFGAPVSFVGVASDFSVNSTLEAAGNLIDVLDAAEDREGVVLLNVAPRGGQKEDGHNGTPFGYFWYKNVLVISTVKGQSLSLVKKLDLVKVINLMSVDDVMEFGVEQGLVDKKLQDYVAITQFRSFDFVPRVAGWLKEGREVPYTKTSLENIVNVGACIWYLDAFGNAKTTILASEISVDPGGKIKTNLGEFNFYYRLKDLPKGETAFYIGSSGIESRRFVEIATQKVSGSAEKSLGLKLGDEIKIES